MKHGALSMEAWPQHFPSSDNVEKSKVGWKKSRNTRQWRDTRIGIAALYAQDIDRECSERSRDRS
jgi:hypothetical protein